MKPTVGAHEARRIAVEAIADPRTVVKYLSGAPVRSTVAVRIEAALRTMHLSAHGDSPTRRKQTNKRS